MKNLYHTDFHQWAKQQKEYLTKRQFDRLDLDNLIGEVDDMGRSERNTLESHLVILVLHLLKYQYQTYVINPNLYEPKEFRSWYDSISQARLAISRLIRKNPSLKHEKDDALLDCYPDAKHAAIREMNQYLRENHQLDHTAYPDTCPWTFEQITSENWLPDQ
ncbi:hypothetical protein GZ77_23375 [Endozoicomonas montiporae]|uniref:DUF29 domain-containing protein n=2 Tax=Endozoicomonas montiporae TaxID=1027273 RepID=A0A081N0Q6_9GAMM|nr:DUF29 domain-containing protein [Endozoicomonas montiporae]AMO54506.1 hypothetical protein EZMO1_0241 [Endozoicomonas montiporae CL-33]KEQ12029.1 hypothetical protein GZ77_23375 [Endozoicomonas montiporae]